MTDAFSLLKSKTNKAQLIPSFQKVERKLLSTFMASLDILPAFRSEVLKLAGYKSGKTCQYKSVMEPQYTHPDLSHARPDGLIQCKRGTSTWSAFIEAKAENKEVGADQMTIYATLAKKLDVNAVISISNTFSPTSVSLPYNLQKSKKSGREIFHFAWPELRTLLSNLIESEHFDTEAEILVAKEVLRFMHDVRSGVQTFDQMSAEWPKFIDASAININLKSIAGFAEIISDWRQERRDLLDKLSGIAGQSVRMVHEAGLRAEQEEKDKTDRNTLAQHNELRTTFQFMGSSSLLSVTANLNARSIKTQITFFPPIGKKAKATNNWLVDRLKDLTDKKLFLTITWPGHTADSILTIEEFLGYPDQIFEGKKEAPKSITLSKSINDARKFRSRKGFIESLETTVLDFHKNASNRDLI